MRWQYKHKLNVQLKVLLAQIFSVRVEYSTLSIGNTLGNTLEIFVFNPILNTWPEPWRINRVAVATSERLKEQRSLCACRKAEAVMLRSSDSPL